MWRHVSTSRNVGDTRTFPTTFMKETAAIFIFRVNSLLEIWERSENWKIISIIQFLNLQSLLPALNAALFNLFMRILWIPIPINHFLLTSYRMIVKNTSAFQFHQSDSRIIQVSFTTSLPLHSPCDAIRHPMLCLRMKISFLLSHSKFLVKFRIFILCLLLLWLGIMF